MKHKLWWEDKDFVSPEQRSMTVHEQEEDAPLLIDPHGRPLRRQKMQIGFGDRRR